MQISAVYFILILFFSIRDDFTSKNSNKKSHHVLQEDLRPWRHLTRRHSLEASSLEPGRYLRKPHYTVEEASLQMYKIAF